MFQINRTKNCRLGVDHKIIVNAGYLRLIELRQHLYH